jgi:hypothetical protein
MQVILHTQVICFVLVCLDLANIVWGMGGARNTEKSWGNKIEKQKEHDEHHNEDHGNKVGRQKGHNEHQDDYLKQQNWKVKKTLWTP